MNKGGSEMNQWWVILIAIGIIHVIPYFGPGFIAYLEIRKELEK